MSWDLSKIKPTMQQQSVYFNCLLHAVLYLHNDHIQAQNKHTANGVLFEATHLQWRCCVREISFLITSQQLTNELGERMGSHDNRKKCSNATETSSRHTPLRIKPQWQQHWRTGGGSNPPPKFRRPSKIVPNSTRFVKTVKNC